jgi:hypothetical protein
VVIPKKKAYELPSHGPFFQGGNGSAGVPRAPCSRPAHSHMVSRIKKGKPGDWDSYPPYENVPHGENPKIFSQELLYNKVPFG